MQGQGGNMVFIKCMWEICQQKIEFTEKLVQSYIQVVSSSLLPYHWQKAAITSDFLVFPSVGE